MKRWSVLLLSVLLAFAPAAYAQFEAGTTPPPENVPVQAQPTFTQQELDQMLAPIALYPDPLLSQVLMASTYPLEVVEAARWSRANPGLKGDDAVKAVQQMDWDASVKSLVAFPQIVQAMDENLDWTERLGDAFLAQEAQVMDTVQNLRQKAYATGNFRSNDQLLVEQQGQAIAVEPANPQMVYVPYYDPNVAYGSWWWPDYPPIYWAPWPGYSFAPYYAPGFAWDLGIIITTGFFFGDFDWRHHHVNVVNVNNYYYTHHRRKDVAPGAWRHDPDHRRGVPYRETSLHQQFGRTPASPEARRDFRGYDQSSFGRRGGTHERRAGETGTGIVATPVQKPRMQQPLVQPQVQQPPTQQRQAQQPPAQQRQAQQPPAQQRRAQQPPVQQRQAQQPRVQQPYERGPQFRQGAPTVFSRPAPEVRPPAFQDIGRGSSVRDYSSRGRSSYEGTVRAQPSAPAQQPSGSAPAGGTPGGGQQHQRRRGD